LVEHAGSSVVAAALAGACLGFLPFNFRAGGLLRSSWVTRDRSCSASPWAASRCSRAGGAGGVAAAIAAPLLILAVPALDTGLVLLVRLGERRPFWQGAATTRRTGSSTAV
jgi:hypothetical protein